MKSRTPAPRPGSRHPEFDKALRNSVGGACRAPAQPAETVPEDSSTTTCAAVAAALMRVNHCGECVRRSTGARPLGLQNEDIKSALARRRASEAIISPEWPNACASSAAD